MNNGVTELYRKHRPKLFKEVIGQDDAVAVLQGFLKQGNFPHALLLSGPSGTGKTTQARILKDKLKCSELDFYDINAASSRGIDTIRDVQARVTTKPFGGGNRVWLFDECHRLTHDSMSGLLKVLEDPPSHAYFILCTTDPQKLLTTIRTRTTEVKLSPLARECVREVIEINLGKEGGSVEEEVLEALVDSADGSARTALVNLHKILGLPKEQQLEILEEPDVKAKAIDLCRALINPNNKGKWGTVAKLLKKLEGEDLETTRLAILGYANKVLLDDSPQKYRGFLLIKAMQYDFFQGGWPALTAACFDVLNGE